MGVNLYMLIAEGYLSGVGSGFGLYRLAGAAFTSKDLLTLDFTRDHSVKCIVSEWFIPRHRHPTVVQAS